MLSLVELDRTTWNEHWPCVLHAPLTQSWEYGEGSVVNGNMAANVSAATVRHKVVRTLGEKKV